MRPNSGIVKANETAVINVMLQPVDQPTTLENERYRHKFMIQVISFIEPKSHLTLKKFQNKILFTFLIYSSVFNYYKIVNMEAIFVFIIKNFLDCFFVG